MGVGRIGSGINSVDGAWRLLFAGRKFRNWEERECGRGGGGLNGGRGERFREEVARFGIRSGAGR